MSEAGKVFKCVASHARIIYAETDRWMEQTDRRTDVRTYVRCVAMLCGQVYMCLKLSITSSGKSSVVLPMWCSGCVNFRPSAVSSVTTSTQTHYRDIHTDTPPPSSTAQHCLHLSDLIRCYHSIYTVSGKNGTYILLSATLPTADSAVNL